MCNCRRLRYVEHFVCAARLRSPHKPRCARARLMKLRASEWRQRRQMCASRCVRVAIVTTRTYALLYRSAPPSEFLIALHFLTALDCRFCSAFASGSPLLLVSSASALCSALSLSALSSALVSAFCPFVAHLVRHQHNYLICNYSYYTDNSPGACPIN